MSVWCIQFNGAIPENFAASKTQVSITPEATENRTLVCRSMHYSASSFRQKKPDESNRPNDEPPSGRATEGRNGIQKLRSRHGGRDALSFWRETRCRSRDGEHFKRQSPVSYKAILFIPPPSQRLINDLHRDHFREHSLDGSDQIIWSWLTVELHHIAT